MTQLCTAMRAKADSPRTLGRNASKTRQLRDRFGLRVNMARQYLRAAPGQDHSLRHEPRTDAAAGDACQPKIAAMP